MFDWFKKKEKQTLPEKVEKIRENRNKLTTILTELQKNINKHEKPNDRFNTLVNKALFYAPQVFYDLLLLKVQCFSVVTKKKKLNMKKRTNAVKKNIGNIKDDLAQEVGAIKDEMGGKFPGLVKKLSFRKKTDESISSN